jgi:hypothetical protein
VNRLAPSTIARSVWRRKDYDFTLRVSEQLREDAAFQKFLRWHSIANVRQWAGYATDADCERAIRNAACRRVKV